MLLQYDYSAFFFFNRIVVTLLGSFRISQESLNDGKDISKTEEDEEEEKKKNSCNMNINHALNEKVLPQLTELIKKKVSFKQAKLHSQQ